MSERLDERGFRIWKESNLPQEVVPLSDLKGIIAQLEKALKYCQDDKVVMQNQINVLEAKLAAHKENEGDECPLCACEKRVEELEAECGELLDELETWRKHNELYQLYNDHVKQAIKLWQDTTGNTTFWPDNAQLIAWLFEQFTQLKAERDALRKNILGIIAFYQNNMHPRIKEALSKIMTDQEYKDHISEIEAEERRENEDNN